MGNNKNVLLTVRMSEEDRARLKTEAHQHNMNMAEYIRYLLEKERKDQFITTDDFRKTPPPDDVDEKFKLHSLAKEVDDHTLFNVIDYRNL